MPDEYFNYWPGHREEGEKHRITAFSSSSADGSD